MSVLCVAFDPRLSTERIERIENGWNEQNHSGGIRTTNGDNVKEIETVDESGHGEENKEIRILNAENPSNGCYAYDFRDSTDDVSGCPCVNCYNTKPSLLALSPRRFDETTDHSPRITKRNAVC